MPHHIDGTKRLKPSKVLAGIPGGDMSWATKPCNELPPAGAHIAIRGSSIKPLCDWYRHHAIYVGTRHHWIIHYSGKHPRDIKVRFGTFEEFVKNRATHRLCLEASDPPAKVVTRALLNIGRQNFDFAIENCECFASFCRHGTPVSYQAGSAGIGFVTFGWACLKRTWYNYLDFENVCDDADGKQLIRETETWMNVPLPQYWPSFVKQHKLDHVPVADLAQQYAALSSKMYCSTLAFSSVCASWYDHEV